MNNKIKWLLKKNISFIKPIAKIGFKESKKIYIYLAYYVRKSIIQRTVFKFRIF